jgi:uncharacterized protein (DUF924 family)
LFKDESEPVGIDVPADWVAQLTDFWFTEHGDADWWHGGPDFDAAVTERFGGWREALRSLPLDHFLIDTDTTLAAIILFDQVPRNAHRGTAEAFATDHMALALARSAVAAGTDTGLSKNQRLFLYLPFEHSEDADDQRESVRLIGTLGDARLTQFALDHQAMITRFGRFPHRNPALGRPDRPGEAEAVAAGGGW